MFEPRALTVAEAMTRDVYIIRPDTTLLEARRILDSHGFHHLPVVENDRLSGLISLTDILLISQAFPLDDPDGRSDRNRSILSRMLASEVMSRKVVSLRPDMNLEVAVGIFLENLFHALPVVDDDGELIGILTLLDLVRVAYVPQLNVM